MSRELFLTAASKANIYSIHNSRAATSNSLFFFLFCFIHLHLDIDIFKLHVLSDPKLKDIQFAIKIKQRKAWIIKAE